VFVILGEGGGVHSSGHIIHAFDIWWSCSHIG